MTRIVFNGREYASREAMPDDVRRAYDEALATLQKVFPGKVADAGDALGEHTAVDVQREISFSFKGPGGEPLPVPARPIGESDDNPLHTPMAMLLAFAAGFVLVFGVALMFVIGGGRSHLPGRLMVAVTALFLLGGLDTMATRLARRRESLLGPDSPGYRRFILWSAGGLALAAVLLLGIAWFLP